ncbi:hypothetical protein BCUN_1861 [Bifidobacterium cuniculi]|uniref:Minor tail protein n=1 Tax=Bifidobacterium cuniculi TaxID=1688 RepID=A0A087AFG3_9BIFI|nr:hypothetical protein [Bifidobacterium cuniculi]KFI57513.1 hypothetical protein BCUN_1861 [Bifidobacterium cuniculi]
MATTALGVSATTDNVGVTPLTHRLILGSYFQDTGVIYGLGVTGRSDLSYAVSAGCAVVQRAPSDGMMLAYWEGGATENRVSAGDPSNPRIDVVWIRANNSPEYPADPDNRVHVGVTQGVPAVSPVKPAIPAGCTEIGARLMPAGATSTQSTTKYETVNYALPYGANRGKIAESWLRQDFSWTAAAAVIVKMQKVSFTLPSDRILRFDYKCNFSAQGATKDSISEWAMAFYVDGKVLDHSAVNFVSHATSWTTHETSYTAEIPAGEHTAEVGGWFGYGSKPNFHYSGGAGTAEVWVGRRFSIWDAGAAR